MAKYGYARGIWPNRDCRRNPFRLKALLASFEKSIRDKLWQAAAARWCGRGLEEGIVERQWHQSFRRIQRDHGPQIAGALRAMSTATLWTGSRKLEVLSSSSSSCEPGFELCPRCRNHVETPLHMIWQCPRNSELECFQATETLASKACRQAEELPCLWLRGLVPRTWMPDMPPLRPTEYRALGTCQEGMLTPIPGDSFTRLFGDASGVRGAQWPELRRTGMGLAQIPWSPPWRMLGGLSWHVGPFEEQEVLRGELLAFLEGLQRVKDNLVYCPDNDQVYYGFVARC